MKLYTKLQTCVTDLNKYLDLHNVDSICNDAKSDLPSILMGTI